jgi:hypothetical protein
MKQPPEKTDDIKVTDVAYSFGVDAETIHLLCDRKIIRGARWISLRIRKIPNSEFKILKVEVIPYYADKKKHATEAIRTRAKSLSVA